MNGDADLTAAIQVQLRWSPFVDAADVNVEVEGGVATLTGTVDSLREMNAAVQNAFEGGAIWVDNELRYPQPATGGEG